MTSNRDLYISTTEDDDIGKGYKVLSKDGKEQLDILPWSDEFVIPTLFYNGKGKDFTVAVTGRNFRRYPSKVINIVNSNRLTRNSKVLEIGSGLGGLIPQLILKGLHPTVVDKMDIVRIRQLLEFAKEQIIKDFEAQRFIKGYIARCDLLTDPRKVTLINDGIEEVLDRGTFNPQSFDLVVDYNSTKLWADKDKFGKIKSSLLTLVNSEENLVITDEGTG